MGAIEIILAPASPGRFIAFLGERELCRSRQPFFAGARVLLAEGVEPGTELTARHIGSPIVAMRSTVGEAAKWTIEETDAGGLRKRRWKASPRWDGSAPAADLPDPVPECPRAGGFSAAPPPPADDFAPGENPEGED